ncbi:ArnT family glycosyltransferase [Parasphingorhabdus pacifica]
MSPFVAGYSTIRDGTDTSAPPAELPTFARAPVIGFAAAVAVLLISLSNRYGYLSDELYFLAAGKYHLDWGFMDQQPLVPLVAAGIDAAFPGSLVALRLPSALVTSLGIVVTALIAREFGGDRRAQLLAACAYPLAPWLLLSGHWLAAATIEPLQWSSILWLLARWTRLRIHGIDHGGSLVMIGLVVALSLQNKFQVLVLCVALLISIAAVGPRPLLGRPPFWAGIGIALSATAPTVFWQAQHGWPAFDMGVVVGSESDRALFLPTALFYCGLPVGAVMACAGWWYLIRSPALRPYRYLGLTVAIVVLFYLAVSGRPNYPAGLFGLLFAAAAVGWQARRTRLTRRVRRWPPIPVYLLSALLPVALLPIYPLPLLARHPDLVSYSRMYETGWPELARTTARSYRSLPRDLRNRTAIVGQTYYLAAALEVHGRELGLPPAHSPDRGYWFFGPPPDEADAVLYVGNDRALAPHFGRARRLDVVTGPLVNLARGNTVTLYEDPEHPWSHLWGKLRTW